MSQSRPHFSHKYPTTPVNIVLYYLLDRHNEFLETLESHTQSHLTIIYLLLTIRIIIASSSYKYGMFSGKNQSYNDLFRIKKTLTS